MSSNSFWRCLLCLSSLTGLIDVTSTIENACNDSNDVCEINSNDAKNVNVGFLEKNVNNANVTHFERYGYQFVCYSGVFSPAVFDASGKLQVSPFFPIVENKTIFLDMGCGTGYYGITAVLKGAKYGLGLDVTEDAIENTQANAVLHNLGNEKNRFQVFKSNLFSIFDSNNNNNQNNTSNNSNSNSNENANENKSEMESPIHSVFDIMYFDIPWHASDSTGEFEKLKNEYSGNTQKDKQYTNLFNSVYDIDYRLTSKFLKDAKTHLRKDTGVIYTLLSQSVGDMKLFNKTVKDNGYSQALYQQVSGDSYTAEFWELRVIE